MNLDSLVFFFRIFNTHCTKPFSKELSRFVMHTAQRAHFTIQDIQ